MSIEFKHANISAALLEPRANYYQLLMEVLTRACRC